LGILHRRTKKKDATLVLPVLKHEYYPTGGLSAEALYAVTQLTSTGGSLTLSPTTGIGVVDVSHNLSHANTWIATQAFGNTYLSLGGATFDITKNTALATGDIIIYDGTNWINLAVGTGSQVLGVSGGIPTWEAVPATAGVTSLGGVTGAITLSSGLSMAASVLTVTFPTVVTSFATKTGAITLGSGLSMSSNELDVTFPTVVTSFATKTGAITLGSGLSMSSNELDVTFPTVVTSLGAQTGAITLSSGLSMVGSVLTVTFPTVVTSIDSLTGAVTTSSPNSTLSLSTTSQNRNFDINLGNANSWTGVQSFGNTYLSLGGKAFDITKNTVLATGDIIFYDGTNWINLAVGASASYVLGVSGGLPAWVVGSNPLVASAKETKLTTTGATNVINYTTVAAGNYAVNVYFRVVTGATVVTLTYVWTDVTGAQSYTYLSAVSESTGSYTMQPLFFNATNSSAIQVTATAGTANQVYVSASVILES
jgi:hypothetical protein